MGREMAMYLLIGTSCLAKVVVYYLTTIYSPMKRILLTPFFLLLISQTSFSQQQEIVKILNKELKKEISHQFKDPDFSGDTLWVVTPYRIDSNVLSVTIRKKDPYDGKYYTEKQEIALDKIKSIVKDINVIFEAEGDAVRITQTATDTDGPPAAETRYYNLFFLQLSYEKQNEALADKLVKAFKKAGFTIEKRFWYD